MAEHFVYVLLCSDDTLYCGYTTDVVRRVDEHNGKRPGGARYTRGRGPVTVVYQESFSNRSDAQAREAQIKKLPKKLKQELISL